MPRLLTFHNVSFSYGAPGGDLFAGLGVSFAPGWTGIVGSNGCGKTTLLRLAAGELAPVRGEIQRPPAIAYCPQRTDAPPALLAPFLTAADALACELRGRLGVAPDYLARWDTLSHGERKRAQIAAALWQEPDVLAVDEPSNHIDATARELLLARLAEYRGIGLLVSHDRALLDRLCQACLFIDPPQAVLRPGGYTQAFAQHQADIERERELYTKAQREMQRLRQELQRRRQDAARKQKQRSKRGIAAKDHDAKTKVDMARLTDSKDAASLRQMQGRIAQAADKLAAYDPRKDMQTGIFVPGRHRHHSFLLHLESGAATAGGAHGGAASAEAARVVAYPELHLAADARVALTGANGAGKSTLLEHIVPQLNLPRERVLYMPQELPARQAAALLAEARALTHQELGLVLSIIARLGSDAKRVLATELPSPGEARKLLLALGIVRETRLIIMDEPTNHLDLPSIQCLEDALAPFPGGLLLVSHDLVFLRKLCKARWDLAPDPQVPALTHLRIEPGW